MNILKAFMRLVLKTLLAPVSLLLLLTKGVLCLARWSAIRSGLLVIMKKEQSERSCIISQASSLHSSASA